jgi:hypothetical protein
MTLYRKKPTIVAAFQWFKNGDHPLDMVAPGSDKEGEFIKRHVMQPWARDDICGDCHRPYKEHGCRYTPKKTYIICPGDYIVTDENGEHTPYKPATFKQVYEAITERHIVIRKDGDSYMCSWSDFINVQESPCEFGVTPIAALTQFLKL